MRKQETFFKALDEVFHKEPEYLVFWDKDGILQGGLWILFGRSETSGIVNQLKFASSGAGSQMNGANVDTGGRVLKIIPDQEFGDIMLCIDSDMTYEEMVDCEPDLMSIVGFATIAPQEPEYIPKYLQEYWSRIQGRCKQSGFSGYKRAVYEHILVRLQRCQLLHAKDVTMRRPGVVSIVTSGTGSRFSPVGPR